MSEIQRESAPFVLTLRVQGPDARAIDTRAREQARWFFGHDDFVLERFDVAPEARDGSGMVLSWAATVTVTGFSPSGAPMLPVTKPRRPDL